MADSINDLISIFRDEGAFYNTPNFHIGKVNSTLPNIKISYNNLILEKENLMISSHLKVLNDCKIECACPDCNIKHNLQDKLKVGDIVIMQKYEEKFIILNKVVQI